MSDEVKAKNGIPQSQAIWVDGKGTAKTINKLDVGQQKGEVALAQMEAASADLNSVINEYDPNSFGDMFAKLDMPVMAKNMLRNQAERTVNSAKKSWAEMVLRDATGAVINQSEYDDYDVIFMPQPGETQQELEIKAKRRHDKENAYRARIGRAAKTYVSPYKEEEAPTDVKQMTDEQLLNLLEGQ